MTISALESRPGSTPRVSVLIPAYNPGTQLPIALASVVLQTLADWECVVVDDGSEPRLRLPSPFAADDRFRLIRHDRNRGRGAARVTALSAARGELIAWLDADDWSFPERLECQVGFLERHPDVQFVGCAAARLDGEERCVDVARGIAIESRTLEPLDRPPVIHASLMFRRGVLDQVEYRPTLRYSEDFDFLTRALSRFRFANLQRVLYAYRREQSQSVSKYFRSTMTRLRVVREHAHRRPLAAVGWAVVYTARLLAYALLAWSGTTVGRRGRGAGAAGEELVARSASIRRKLERIAVGSPPSGDDADAGV